MLSPRASFLFGKLSFVVSIIKKLRKGVRIMHRKKNIWFLCGLMMLAVGCTETYGTSDRIVEAREGAENMKAQRLEEKDVRGENKRTIYLAGGCFWGVEGYFKKIPGVYDTETGYANGKTEKTDYESVKETDHTETVKVSYDRSRVSLEEILLHYFGIIDPTSVDRQGNDVGRQYRTGIYYTSEEDREIIEKILAYETRLHGTLAVEKAPLKNFLQAEAYHQDYLDKNPGGYCHINLALADAPLFDEPYEMPTEEKIRELLDDTAYDVMRNAGTERAGTSALSHEYRKGIYVDKITGEPLFSSSDKFDSGCGWPSFSRPITTDKLTEHIDNTLGMTRTEVRTKHSDSHLGHVFEDGPAEKGGLRYCINGAALRFIPYEDMDKAGYGAYKIFCE